MPVQSRELYLTFDDGPIPGPTEYVLEQLHRAKAKATFFCIGNNVRKHPEVFKKILEHGSVVGNHTYDHLSGWRTGIAPYLENVNMCAAELQRYLPPTGHPVQVANKSESPLFRPPYGRITRSQIKSLAAFKIVMWDVLTNDYARNLSPEDCLRETLAATRPGSIVVFHDSFKAERNMRYALPRFLDHFGGLGYSFKCMS